MSSYVGDSELFCDEFSTPEMRIIFDDRNTVQRWLDTEVALAQAEADLGLIPQEAAIQILEAGNASEYDLEALKVEMDRTSHPIVPLVRAMESKCSQEVGGIFIGERPLKIFWTLVKFYKLKEHYCISTG